MTCQNCKGEVATVHDFGPQPLCNDLRPEAERYPLTLVRCGDCGLVQLSDPLPSETTFPDSYPYRSRMTGELVENFRRLAKAATGYCGLRDDSLVVDIGSNDGSLLMQFQCRVLGIEPTDAARDAQILTLKECFTPALAREIAEKKGRADLVTACNAFAHIPDVHDVLDGIEALLKPDGIFVCENHDFTGLVLRNQWDTVYHEHARYYTVDALERVIEPHGLFIRRVEYTLTHGGSFRAWIGRQGTDDPSIGAAVLWDRAVSVNGLSERIDISVGALGSMIADQGTVWGIGAPSRGGMLVSYGGLDLEAVCELPGSPKIGQHMPGTDIPIVDEAELFHGKPPAVLILSWHSGPQIAAKLRAKGYEGRIFAPLPMPTEL